MTEWIEIPNVSLSNNDARQVAAVNSICSETEQRGSLLERQLGLNSILDTFPETNSIVASRIALLNETGHSHSRVKNRVSTRVAITFVCGMQ